MTPRQMDLLLDAERRRARARELRDRLWRGDGDNAAIGPEPVWQETACDEGPRRGVRETCAAAA